MPWFYDTATKQFATYDPSAFAGSIDALGDMTGLLSHVGRNGLDETGIWATGFGGVLDHAGDGAVTLDRRVGQGGFAFGYSGMAESFGWSAMGGYLSSHLDVASPWTPSHDIDGGGFFAGVNKRHTIGQIDIDFGVSGGRLDYTSRRFVNDNLALTNGRTLGESWAEASFDGWFVSPSLAVGMELAEIDGWTLMANTQLGYTAQWLGGFTETGSNANATVSARSLGVVQASVEIAAAKKQSFGTTTGRLGYQARRSIGDSNATVALLNTQQTIGFGNTGLDTVYAGAGIDFKLGNEATQLKFDVTGFFGGTTTGAEATATLSSAF